MPGVNEDDELRAEPVAVLERKLVKTKNSPATMVLVQWSNGDRNEAT